MVKHCDRYGAVQQGVHFSNTRVRVTGLYAKIYEFREETKAVYGGFRVANIKSQKKRIITNEKAHQRNRAVKSELKTAVRRVRDAVAAGDGTKAYAEALTACRLMDKAAAKGIIHKNQAANRKSKIMKLANTVVTDEIRAAYVKPEPKAQKTGSKKAARKAERAAAYEKKNAEKAARVKKQQEIDKKAAAKKAKAAAEAADEATEEAAE